MKLVLELTNPHLLLLKELPNYEQRRAMLSRDPLACADGFHTLVLLTLKHLLGVRCCPRCPDCNATDEPCMNSFGSNATARGGVFGRVDAVYGSIECQKSGTLHGHFQIFIQCFHQFTPLKELIKLQATDRLEMLRRYTAYSAHVTRTVYADPEAWRRDKDEVEAEWPEYQNCLLMLSRPTYQRDANATPAAWKLQYLHEDVEQLQQRKQHHVHLPDGPNGERRPLAHCRDPKDPNKCKSGFPRNKWLTEEALVICPGLADKMGMPCKGKRSMVGLTWGPCNDESLNGHHPALLAALRCNGDVQVPYRFPIMPEYHHASCQQDCDQTMPIWSLVRDAQITQAAQTGYQCDYQNKRLPICRHEAKEWEKGQKNLQAELHDKKPGYVGARLAKRLITDCYARGVCRGAVECTNLILHSQHHDPTRAEAIKTAPVAEMALQYPLHLIQCLYNEEPWPQEPRRKQVDRRNYFRRQLTDCPFWTAYGARGSTPSLHRLSAYEFHRHFHFQMAKHPRSKAGHEKAQESTDDYQARLTEAGLEKVERFGKTPTLSPGIDYQIIEEGGDWWHPLGTGEKAQTHRHDWVIVPRRRPHVPVVYGAQGGKTEEEQALRMLTLFFPWVNDINDATLLVPYIGHFREPGMTSWRQALRARVLRYGFPTEEVKRFAINFCFAYFLPRHLQPTEGLAENSDNENLEDEPVTFLEEDLLQARLTHVRGAPKMEAANNEAADVQLEATKQYDLTMDMFRCSEDIWLSRVSGVSQAELQAQQETHRHTMQERAAAIDHTTAKQAARASRARPQHQSPAQGTGGMIPHEPTVEAKPPLTAALLKNWLNSEQVRHGTNAQQHKLLQLIVERILVEYALMDPAETLLKSGEPLVYLLHGPPGTGKSFVLSYLHQLFQLIGYHQGIEFEVVAFQAVNAADLTGKTIHHAFGISIGAAEADQTINLETAKRMAYWRWLIFDEISMVNARLLAQAENRLRAVVPNASPWKHTQQGDIRAFAGVNVIFTGDFHQLPPPEGAVPMPKNVLRQGTRNQHAS